MELNYNVTSNDRKSLVTAISEALAAPSEYLGAPTFAYTVDYFTIDKNGTVSFDDRANSEEIENLIDHLHEKGFEAEPAKDSIGFTISVPLDKVVPNNLTKLLNAKGGLIKKALGIDSLPIETDGEKISFPWFSELPDSNTASAYTHFISALCKMSMEQKRINSTEKQVDNEKYAFRCFLLRLGFIGAEYKAERKLLLSKLTGSSAFKNPTDGGADDE